MMQAKDDVVQVTTLDVATAGFAKQGLHTPQSLRSVCRCGGCGQVIAAWFASAKIFWWATPSCNAIPPNTPLRGYCKDLSSGFAMPSLPTPPRKATKPAGKGLTSGFATLVYPTWTCKLVDMVSRLLAGWWPPLTEQLPMPDSAHTLLLKFRS